MATCKDCIHCEACERMISDTSKMFKVLLSEILKMNCDIKYDSTNILSGAEICQCFQDRARFVELPDDFPKGRLTMDNPLGNFDALMNFAYAKGGQVLLRYANNQENMDLCDYIAFHTKGTCNLSAQEVLDGACFECDDFYCPLGRAYFASVQAAELRERLKMYEDLAEQALKEREKNA